MISNDCSSGTPAFSIVASWRVKNVMSFSPTLLPPRNVCRLILTIAHALAPQVGRDDGFGRRARFSAHLPVVPVDALPDERVFLDVAA